VRCHSVSQALIGIYIQDDIVMQNPETFEKVKEMIKFVENVRENPELMQMLVQLKGCEVEFLHIRSYLSSTTDEK